GPAAPRCPPPRPTPATPRWALPAVAPWRSRCARPRPGRSRSRARARRRFRWRPSFGRLAALVGCGGGGIVWRAGRMLLGPGRLFGAERVLVDQAQVGGG